MDTFQIVPGKRLGLPFRHFAHPSQSEHAISENGKARKKIEVLEYHFDLTSRLIDLFNIAGQLDAIDKDPLFPFSSSRLMHRIGVDFPD